MQVSKLTAEGGREDIGQVVAESADALLLQAFRKHGVETVDAVIVFGHRHEHGAGLDNPVRERPSRVPAHGMTPVNEGSGDRQRRRGMTRERHRGENEAGHYCFSVQCVLFRTDRQRGSGIESGFRVRAA